MTEELPEVTEETEQDQKRIFRTRHFKIKVKDETLDKFIEKLDKVNKSGAPKYSETEKHTMRLLWMQKKMKPAIEDDISGEDWQASKEALFGRIYGMDL